MAEVNGIEIPVLRDTGATIDVISRKYITPDMLTGETVWVQQPLDLGPICLPLAQVELSGEFGKVVTKAAVIRDELDQGRYLLGNRTAAMLSLPVGKMEFPVTLCSVQTRAQRRRQESSQIPKIGENNEFKAPPERQGSGPPDDTTASESLQPENEVSTGDTVELNEEEKTILPAAESNSEEISLLEVNRQELAGRQRASKELRPIFDKILKNSNSEAASNEYVIENELLMRTQKDHSGYQRKLLVVPEEYRDRIKSLCHEGTSGHLGVTKSKDRMTRHFFWPGCYKDMENYVRTCDGCQKVGKPNDRKKAPLKIVPIIEEVFSKINIDACGPVTPSGKRYLITAICLSSKYPDAVPVADISSVSVTDALLNIFSRTGFPKEIQCDQGSSFTSELTSEFFERFGVKVRHSSVHHPQSNPVERFHRTVKRILRVLCLEAGPDWEKHLPSALFALRTVTHESTGFSPAELVHGKNLRTPETLLYEHWTEPTEEGKPVTEYVLNLINRLKHCRDLAIEKMKDAQVKQKKWYDKNAIRRDFKPGDLVLILATSKVNKMAVQWIGPGTILSKLSDTNYTVGVPGKKERTQIYHVNMLKPYYKRPELINFLICSQDMEEQVDHDLDFPVVGDSPNTYNFAEIVQESHLEERLDARQIEQLQDMLCKYLKCFSNEPGMTNLVEHDIELTSDKIVQSKPYRASQRQTEILKAEIQKMLDLKIIEVGESDYTSPMILVEAPLRDPRPCIDYRRLNEITRTQFYPLPNIEDRIETVSSAKYISVLDLTKGYWQISLSPKAQRLAAFVTTFGTYRPLKMPFGLKNAPYFFSKLMAELLKGCESFAVPYLDDIAIFSSTWNEHLGHLKEVFQRILQAGLTVKPSKCRFAQDHVKYLGHIVGQGFRRPAELKVQAIKAFPTPRTKTQIRAFLGLAGYYNKYIPMFSAIASPLTDALKGRARKGEIKWTEACEKAFGMLKEKLTSHPVLYAPRFDKEFIIQTDASDVGMGIVLAQLDEKGEEHPILYLSRKFSAAEKKYSTTEKECASIIFAVKRLHYYLDGQKFTIQTDHNPLTWLRTAASSNPRLMRWALVLQPYDFKIVHKPGSQNKNADSLSRSASKM